MLNQRQTLYVGISLVRRENVPPMEENWDSEDEAEEAGADETVDEVEEQAE